MPSNTLIALCLAFGAAFTATWALIRYSGSVAAATRALAESSFLEGVRARIGRDLNRLGRDAESPARWLAASLAQAALAGAGVALSVAVVGLMAIPLPLVPPAAALAGSGAMLALCGYDLQLLRGRAEARARRIVRLLPYSVELIVLIAEAGGSLEDALDAVVTSMPAEPLSDEFGRVLSEQRLGRSFLDALRGLAQRIDNKETTQMVTSIEIGRELGTPLAASLSAFAEWIRTKRVLDGERLAREAAPKMAFPNTMIMAANVLLILAPFLPALASGNVL